MGIEDHIYENKVAINMQYKRHISFDDDDDVWFERNKNIEKKSQSRISSHCSKTKVPFKRMITWLLPMSLNALTITL